MWHNLSNYPKIGYDGNEYACFSCQRPWDWCEPGQTSQQKILPEPQSERGIPPQVSEPDSSLVIDDAGINPR